MKPNSRTLANKPSFGAGFGFGGGAQYGITSSTVNTFGGGAGFSFSNTTTNSNAFFGGITNPTQSTGLGGAFSFSGTPAATTTSAFSGGLSFGTPAKTTGSAFSLFNKPQTTAPSFQMPATGGLSFNAFNTQTPALTTTVSGQPVYTEATMNQITMDTKFHQLPESVRRVLVQMAKEIERQKEMMVSIDTVWPDVKGKIQSATNEAQKVSQHTTSFINKLEASHRLVVDLEQQLVRQKIYHDNAKDANLAASDSVFQKYLNDTIESMEERVQQYDENVQELERHILAISNATRGQVTPSAIPETMRLQHESFMIIAGKVAALHEAVEKLRKDYNARVSR